MDKKATNKITTKLFKSYTDITGIHHLEGYKLPSRNSITKIISAIKDLLFPGYFDSNEISSNSKDLNKKISLCLIHLSDEIEKSFIWEKENNKTSFNKKNIEKKAKEIAEEFLYQLPELRKNLKKDADAIYDGDPAAAYEPEIILCYPGFLAITVYRIAHFFKNKKVPLIPRIMTEIVHSETGIDIHPAATIGHHFFIDHGTGIVVGETAVIGNHVKFYQGVTIGALSVSKDQKEKKRHPTIEDNVTIYARTTILGGKTIIGKNSIIGGNLWITSSIPNNSKIYQVTDNKNTVIKKNTQ